MHRQNRDEPPVFAIQRTAVRLHAQQGLVHLRDCAITNYFLAWRPRCRVDPLPAGGPRGEGARRTSLRTVLQNAARLGRAADVKNGSNTMNQHSARIETLEPADVARLMRAGKLLLIDVREPAEYAAERIPGALLYPLSSFDAAALPPDATRRVVFHCGSGKRSLTAAERRLAAGEEHAAHMGGGIAAWKAAGLPLMRAGSP